MHFQFLKSAAVVLASLLATAAAVPAATETADASARAVNTTAHEPTYVVLYNNAAQGAAFRTGQLQFKPGSGAYMYPIQILPGYQNLPGHYIVWKMYEHGPGQYTFVNKERGDNLLYSPESKNLVTAYGRPAAVFAIEPAGDGEYLIKLPYEDAVAEALVDDVTDYLRYPVDIKFRPANGSPSQRWTIGKMVGDSDWEWNPWNP